MVRAIQMPRVNLLIADDVGLGKTIEAGMVKLELVIRHRARRILIVCPASLQVQWRDQMRDKFGLDFRIVDSELMRDLAAEAGHPRQSLEPFPPAHHVHRLPQAGTAPAAVQGNLARRRRAALSPPLRHFGRGRSPQLCPRPAVASTPPIRCGPRPCALMVPHFEHKLFLTATPHNGYPGEFLGPAGTLDDQRFARGTMPDRKQLGAVMVRRLKSELPPKFDGSPRFPKRVIDPMEVPYTAEEKAVHAALKKYTQAAARECCRQHGEDGDRIRADDAEEAALLQPRCLCHHTGAARKVDPDGQAKDQPRSSPPSASFNGKSTRWKRNTPTIRPAEEATDDAVEAATRLFREPTAEEAALLKQMRDWATTAMAQGDSKVRRAGQAGSRRTSSPNGKWSNIRVIIFTEYRASQNWLQTILATEGFLGQ